jgi:serine phosphatase RsbU (regulator of sigma subunit)
VLSLSKLTFTKMNISNNITGRCWLWLSIILVLFGFGTYNSYAQVNSNGLPFIKNYTPEEYGEHAQNWAIVKDKRGMMYFANNHGLLEYNGANWKLYENDRSASIRSLLADEDGFVYYGASQDFGVLLPDSLGYLGFFSLYEVYNHGNPDFNTIWNIKKIGRNIYFQSNEKIFRVESPFDTVNIDKIRKSFKIYETESSFHWSFEVFNEFYVREQGTGILKEVNNELKFIEGSEIFANDRVYVMLPFDKDKILICSRNQGITIYDPKEKEAFVNLESEASKVLIESVIYGGVKLPDEKFAISTLQNGVVIFNKAGKIVEQINTQSGIEENMILSIFYDKEFGNLWFSGAVKGIYNVNYGSPFRYWNKNNGLSGAVVDIIRFEQKIYVATNSGVFVLDEEKKGSSKFEVLPDIPYEAWHFLKFKVGEKEKLLIATTGGIFELSENKVSKIVDNKIALQLLQSKIKPNRIFVGLADGFGYISFDENKKKWSEFIRNDSIKNTVKNIYETENGTLYLGTWAAGAIKLKSPEDLQPLMIDSVQGLPLYGSEYSVYGIDSETVISSASGLFKYNEETNKVDTIKKWGINFTDNDYGIYEIQKTREGYWLSLYSNDRKKSKWAGVIRFLKTASDSLIVDEEFSKGIPQQVVYAIYEDGNYFWIGNDNGAYKFDNTKVENYKTPFNINVLKVTTTFNGKDSSLFCGTFYEKRDSIIYLSLKQNDELIPELLYKNNQLTFKYAALFYEQEKNTEYSYRLIGLFDEWSSWKKENSFPFTNLSPGHYRFEVKARNLYGTESNTVSYEFTILPPWYMTIWAITLFFLAAVAFVWLIVRLNVRRLRKDKERLERIVKERTTEIRMKNVELEQQKEEILAQRDEIEAQRDHVVEQKEQIEVQHSMILEQTKSITDSIHYASRIQEALLPPSEVLNEVLPEHFILYKPRDIVSGDFYWASTKNNRTIIVAADCTGHGVPGAFMSMLGISFLNEITNKFDNLHANQILNELKASVKESLRQTGKDNETKDGMDMALCILDFEKMEMEFSGAYNSLFLIRDNELIKYDADRMPVGIYVKDRGSFTNHVIEMKKGDNYYIFSDGYPDQFGGETGSKLMIKRFKKLLLKNHQLPAKQQKDMLDIFLTKWQNHKDENGKRYQQLDDILVIGMKI